MKAQRQSIRRKLRSIIMATTAMAVLLVCIGSVGQDFFDVLADLKSDVNALAQVIIANSAAPLTFGDQRAAIELLTVLRSRPSVHAGCIYTPAGVKFAEYRSGPSASPPPHPGPDGYYRRRGEVELVRGITFDGERVGTLYVASDLRDLHARMLEDAEAGIVVVLGSLLAAFLVASRLQRVISEPIVELARVAKQVSTAGDYRIRATSNSAAATEELGDLMSGFNGMLIEIERRDVSLSLNRLNLEAEVEARTVELSRANMDLTLARDAAECSADRNAELSRSNQLILDAAADGIVGIDPAGSITFINPAGERLLGWSRDEIVRKPLHEIIHGGGDPVRCDIENCEAAKARWSGGLVTLRADTFQRRDGTSFPVEYSATPLSGEGTAPRGLVVTFHDTTERRAIERLKDEFISTVSHELRTPLTSLRGALGLLSSGMLGAVPEKGQRMLQIAVTNTDRLVRLINDILDLERIESGKIELARTTATAQDLMTEAVEGVQSMADAAGVEIVSNPIEASLWVDRDRILQTLTNLLSNAIKFSPPETTITLSGTLVGGTFTFRVADQGRGVPADKQELIFDRFKQVDASDSRDKGGSGLGLAISRSIVNAHGGRIWAESVGGSGSVFQFTVPPRETSPVEEVCCAPRRLLVCEEEPSDLAPMAALLESHGYHVNLVTAAELSARAGETQPDTILLDLATNDGHGSDLVAALKSNASTREIPIVVATAFPELCEGFAAAITSWVRKPFDTEALIDAIATACAASTPTILIVEDDPDLARVMIASLEARGIRILHAATGGEALEAVRNGEPNLIVLDLVLPDTDGFAVVDCLRSDATLLTIPLLIYSAREVGTAEQARLKLGPTEFMTKSRGTLKDFEAHVIRLLDRVTAPRTVTLDAA